jgi:hypothetical protein
LLGWISRDIYNDKDIYHLYNYILGILHHMDVSGITVISVLSHPAHSHLLYTTQKNILENIAFNKINVLGMYDMLLVFQR